MIEYQVFYLGNQTRRLGERSGSQQLKVLKSEVSVVYIPSYKKKTGDSVENSTKLIYVQLSPFQIEVIFAGSGESTFPPPVAQYDNPLMLYFRVAEFEDFSASKSYFRPLSVAVFCKLK